MYRNLKVLALAEFKRGNIVSAMLLNHKALLYDLENLRDARNRNKIELQKYKAHIEESKES